jgi:hypothetical protein
MEQGGILKQIMRIVTHRSVHVTQSPHVYGPRRYIPPMCISSDWGHLETSNTGGTGVNVMDHNWNEHRKVALTTYRWWTFGGCCPRVRTIYASGRLGHVDQYMVLLSPSVAWSKGYRVLMIHTGSE